jgi:hypothetical protein
VEGKDRIGVNGDGILNAASVSTGDGCHDRNATAVGGAKNEFVARSQTVERESEAAEHVILVGIGAGDVKNDVRLESGESCFEGRAEDHEILDVFDSVVEREVAVRRRLDEWVVVSLVDVESEDCGVRGEDGGGSIALVHVGIDNHCMVNDSLRLQRANRDGNIIDGAEPLPMVRKSVVVATAKVAGPAMDEGKVASQNGAAGVEQKAVSHFPRPRKLEFLDLVGS